MRYATPTRSAHRAAPAGVLGLLVRFPATGQHRRRSARARSRRHLRREPHPTAHLLTRGLAALIVLGIVVMLGVLVVADERRPSGRTLASQNVDERIASRAVDPSPLTVEEVFPAGSAAFGVTRGELTADCVLAAGGALGQTLQRYGCSQAVRAALTVPYADYRITAGLLNLPDTPTATALSDQIRSLVETGDGGFAEMSGGNTGPGAPVLWRTRGHYVMYCVITGPDGDLVPAGDPRVQRITAELLDAHLHDGVLVRRARA